MSPSVLLGNDLRYVCSVIIAIVIKQSQYIVVQFIVFEIKTYVRSILKFIICQKKIKNNLNLNKF